MGDPVVELAILLWRYETDQRDEELTPDGFRSLLRSTCYNCISAHTRCAVCSAKRAMTKAEWIHAQQLAPQR